MPRGRWFSRFLEVLPARGKAQPSSQPTNAALIWREASGASSLTVSVPKQGKTFLEEFMA